MSRVALLEQQKHELLDELRRWTPPRLAFQPAAGEWSVLQMLDHIIRTEREILLAVYSNEHRPHRFGIADRLRNRLLNAVFRSDRKVKVPSSASVVLPGDDIQLSTLSAEWAQVRTTLGQNVDRLVECYSGKALFRHPVGGWMDMPAVLDFLSVHILHHGFQLQRLRVASVHLQHSSR